MHDFTELIREAQRIAVLTGAGMSAERGIPTFRDAQTGHWAKFRPEELATPEAFRREPGATMVELNPEETPLSAMAHFSLRGTAADLLPHVVELG